MNERDRPKTVTKIVTIYYAPESACMYVMVCA